jgi:uncharacterized protein (DUF58 family)
MRRVAGTALSVASLFLGMVAVLINAPALFYMSFALIATLLACNAQSWLAAKALRIERVAPKSVHVGELITIEMILWSDRKIKRPLVTITDDLPKKLSGVEALPSLPVAPAYDLPVRTMYQFRATKRGVFRWKNVHVTATDALGLTIKTVQYLTEPTEIMVVPTAIPISLELPSSAGWGINEAISGRSAGAGIEPRGIREFTHGDSLRHVHWRSSARTGVLQVKEFQAGSQGSAAFILQNTAGSELEGEVLSSLDLMCGHALYLSEQLLRQGVQVSFPLLENDQRTRGEAERKEEIEIMLGRLMSDSKESLGEQLIRACGELQNGSTIYIFAAKHDESLFAAMKTLKSNFNLVVLAYRLVTKTPSKLRWDSAHEYVDAYRQLGSNAVLVDGGEI